MCHCADKMEPEVRNGVLLAGLYTTGDSAPLSEKPPPCCLPTLMLVSSDRAVQFLLDLFHIKKNIFSIMKCCVLGNK